MSAIGRVGTWVAVVALGLNAVLLGWAGIVGRRPALIAGGAVAGAAAVGVILAWRAHRRSLASLREEQLALRDEATTLRDLLRRPR